MERAEFDSFEAGERDEDERESILAQLSGKSAIESEAEGWVPESVISNALELEVHEVETIAITLGIEPRYIGTAGRRRVAYSQEHIGVINKEIEYQNLPQELSNWAITRHVRSGHETVARILDELAVEPAAFYEHGSNKYPLYDKSVIRLLQRYKEKQTESNVVGITEMANALNRSRKTVKRLLEELEISPAKTVRSFGREDPKYDLSVINLIENYDVEKNPPAESWLNMLQLVEEFGEDRSWIERRLVEAGIEPEARRNPVTGKTHDYYPYYESARVIRRAIENRPTEAEEWMTEEALAQTLGRSGKWVKLRLRELDSRYSVRLDANRVARKHYPPETYEQLKEESEFAAKAPPAGEYMSASEIAKALGKSQLWVENRIERFAELAETRKDKLGRLNTRYPPEVLSALSDELERLLEYPEAEGYLTISGLAKAIGHTEYWVKKRIERTGVEPELRRDGIGQLRDHFHPDAVDILREFE